MIKQNNILNKQSNKLHFNRILINDATSYGLPLKFYDKFKGSGGSRSKAAIKIQLQYDLLSGSFLCCDIDNGTSSDGKYVETMDKHTKGGYIRLADLGYYKVDHLKKYMIRRYFLYQN
ncbi:transposase [Clostridium frigidicarnis]|uniref:Transposase DDE domain-containing protein n=1 Tax=Clostridium frigidicarnis TaxID=84698 RepID=A0A1I1BDK5_9CLOT|nr:transposase [Clostridium frigidicarnis]SFB47716.1 Transposase DDE domain-containing protein [Clostridium frigidicarnis]